MAKETQQLIAALRRAGWRVTRTNKSHWKARPPEGGAPVIFASTPSDYRSLKNARSRLRRAGWTG